MYESGKAAIEVGTLLKMPSIPFVVVLLLKVASSGGGFNPKEMDVDYRSKGGNHEKILLVCASVLRRKPRPHRYQAQKSFVV